MWCDGLHGDKKAWDRDLSGFMFAVAAGYRNAGSTPDLFQTGSKSKERARIVGYKSHKWKGAAAKRE